jgi:gas vesicle protein
MQGIHPEGTRMHAIGRSGKAATGNPAAAVVHCKTPRICGRQRTFAKTGSRQEKTMAENETGASGLGWFLAGLGIGALVGVLYAPKSGRETREDIANSAADAQRRAAELMEQGRQRANEYADQGRQLVEQGRQKAADLVEQGRQQAQQYTDKGREYYEKGRSQWSQYVEKGKSMAGEQQAKAGAAVDAAKEAYQSNPAERSTGTAG